MRFLERRLDRLHYLLLNRNASFGADTRDAVYAFQKIEGLARTGVVGPAMWNALARAHTPRASRGGTHIEVHKRRQVLFEVHGGRVKHVVNTSTGLTGNTPVGRWRIYRKDAGFNSLGMLDALYFIGGYAVHGYHSVPPYQASHGCARVPLWAAHGDLPALEHRRHGLRPLMPSVLIVGAGFGGLAAAIELRRHGFDDVRILEKADGFGGTWLHNTYPGAACDVPSHLYSFSFAQRRDWERLCPTQPDILRYQREVVAEEGLEPIIETGTHVTACRWDDAARRWTVETSRGERTADAVIIATGQLHQPATPSLEGEFAGHSFHSAEWDHGYDLRGKRVAVVGTGASAVQFVPPVVEQAAHTTVFQRTGNWFVPRRNRAYPARLPLDDPRTCPASRRCGAGAGSGSARA